MPGSSGSGSRSSSTSAPSKYRLRAPPARLLGKPIAAVFRGHRFTLHFGNTSRRYGIGIPQSSPTMMKSCSSPLPIVPGPCGFVHTYSTLALPDECIVLPLHPTMEQPTTHTIARIPPRKPSRPDAFYVSTSSTDLSTTNTPTRGSCCWSQPSLPIDCKFVLLSSSLSPLADKHTTTLR